MGLTSHKLLALMALLVVFTVLGTLWVWPRLAVRSWPAMFLRLGTIALTQLTLLATLGFAVNDYFVFYSSWSDLLGRERSLGVVQGAGGSPGVPGPPGVQGVQGGQGGQSGQGGQAGQGGAGGTGAAGGPPAGVQVLGPAEITGAGSVGREPARIGRLDRVRLPGATTGLSTDGYVYLPPQYFRPGNEGLRFPAVLVMTGFPGDAANLVTKLRYPATELDLLHKGEVKPTVLVLMRPSPSMPRDSECEDVPGGPQAQSYFTVDVPADLRATYRVLGGEGSLGVMGDSTGGYCAVKLGMAHPRTFPAAVSLSGYFKAAEDVTTGDLFGGDRQRRDEADLNWRLAHLPMPELAVLLADSKEDGTTYADSTAFAAAARPPMVVAQATVDTGGHNFTTWDRLIPPSLGWLSAHLPGPH
ncbi:alpha/beta hydrolase family protein [Kitasatospora sp. SUK 42]|uniref:alpha/beta hydrolase n=1 Tax=Kitasatospora sp. SUK 42 TaxID=1588882 RepID=UPI0018CA38D9|nr:alpha/beta hydrolase-fold protein [Kitasatospora sp. SUK 42]MBV2156734.1 esterase [Kitasatospora sp. SUK 42]